MAKKSSKAKARQEADTAQARVEWPIFTPQTLWKRILRATEKLIRNARRVERNHAREPRIWLEEDSRGLDSLLTLYRTLGPFSANDLPNTTGAFAEGVVKEMYDIIDNPGDCGFAFIDALDAERRRVEQVIDKMGSPVGPPFRQTQSNLTLQKTAKMPDAPDTETDKKPEKKKRVLTDAARACGRAYKTATRNGNDIRRARFCQDWIVENGHKFKNENGKPPSWTTIDKALQNHPEAWKLPDNPADTDD